MKYSVDSVSSSRIAYSSIFGRGCLLLVDGDGPGLAHGHVSSSLVLHIFHDLLLALLQVVLALHLGQLSRQALLLILGLVHLIPIIDTNEFF